MNEPEIINSLRAGRCPDCGGEDWRPGPRGGLAQNVECRQCRSRFNVTKVEVDGVIDVVFAERISREDAGGGGWPPVIFQRGDVVRVTMRGDAATARVLAASDNGISLVIEIEGRPASHALIPVLYNGNGFVSLVTSEQLTIEPMQQ